MEGDIRICFFCERCSRVLRFEIVSYVRFVECISKRGRFVFSWVC